MGQMGPMTAHFTPLTTGFRISGCTTNGAVYHTAPFSLIDPGFVKVNAYRKIKDDRDFYTTCNTTQLQRRAAW